MLPLTRIRNALAHVRRNGLLKSCKYAGERLPEAFYEWRLGISTSGKVHLEDVGINNPYSVAYYPSDYPTIRRAFKHIAVSPGRDVFLDYGCGMGRVLVVAATLPFRRVIGVELAPELADIARDNLRKAAKKLNCQQTEVVTADATSYRVPPDVTVIFLYNPFHGPVLAKVLESIQRSLEDRPRTLTVVFKNTTHLEPILAQHPWLNKQREFAAADGNHKVMILEARVPVSRPASR